MLGKIEPAPRVGADGVDSDLPADTVVPVGVAPAPVGIITHHHLGAVVAYLSDYLAAQLAAVLQSPVGMTEEHHTFHAQDPGRLPLLSFPDGRQPLRGDLAVGGTFVPIGT